MRPLSKRCGHTLIISLALTLPAVAQNASNSVTMTWPNGDRYTGPAFDGDEGHINYGTWSFADGSRLTVNGTGRRYNDAKGNPVTEGADFTPPLELSRYPAPQKEDWPAGALAGGENGTTIVGFVVDEAGVLRDARIMQSSGYDDLDQQAIKFLAKRGYRAPTLGDLKIKAPIYRTIYWSDRSIWENLSRISQPDSTPLNMSGDSPDWIKISNGNCWVRNLYAVPTARISVNWSGSCIGNIASGSGTLIWTANTHIVESYTGGMRDGAYDGQGSWRHEDGTHYDGTFVKGQRNGNGQYSTVGGYWYQGGFKDDRFSGLGQLRVSNGPLLEGIFANGVLPSGKETFADGTIYEGPFAGDIPVGPGHISFSNGDSFDGDVFKEQVPGRSPPAPLQGRFHYANGVIDDGARPGGFFTGTRVLADGTRLENFVSAHRALKTPWDDIKIIFPNRYPAALLEMTVGADGKARNVRILRSSGSDADDRRIIDIVTTDTHFVAATVNGKPVVSWLRFSFYSLYIITD